MVSPSNGTGLVRKVLHAAASVPARPRPSRVNGHLKDSPLATDQRQFLAMLEYAQGLGNEQSVAEKYGIERKQVDRLVKTYKKNLPKNMGAEIAIADQTRAMWGLSPLTPYNPSELVSRKGLKIFDKMRKDDQIKAALGFKKLAVLATGYEISPPKDQDAEWEPVKLVRAVLERVEGTIVQVLFDIMTALDYGYSVSEKVFETIEDGEFKGKIGYKAIKTRAPHSIYFDTDDFGNLKPDGVHQWQRGTDKALDPNRFVIYSYQREFGNWYGRSDLEAVYRSWWIKENSYRWLAMLLERFGIPPIFALYNPTRMNPQQIDSLQSVVEKIQAATAGAIPRPAPEDLEMWAPELAGQTNAVFVPAITMLNHDIARGLLMPGLLGATPDASQGSMARANVHFDVFMLVINFLRDTIEKSIMQEQVIVPLCDLNFPTMDEYPIFKFLPLEEEVKADLLSLWDKMANSGTVHRQPSDEDHIRELLKFPEFDAENALPSPQEQPPPVDVEVGPDGKPILGPDGKPVPKKKPEEAPGQNKPPSGVDKDGNPLPKSEMDAKGIPATVNLSAFKEASAAKIIFDDKGIAHILFEGSERAIPFVVETRQPNRYERRIDFAQIERMLDAAERQAIDALVPIFESVRARLLNYVRRNFDHDHGSIRALNEMKGIRALKSPFMDFLTNTFDKGRDDLNRESNNGTTKAYAAKPNFSPKDAVKFMRNRTDFFISGVNKDLTQKARQVLMTALDKGTSIDQTVNNLSDLFEPYTGNKKVIKDQEQLKPYRLETIVRTNATEAYNRGRLVAAEDAGDLVQGFEWSSVIDQATTEVCQLLDGYVFPDGSDWLTELRPPRHFNCRSILVPITIDVQVDDSDFITDDVAGRALALSGDGFVEHDDARCYCEHLDHYYEDHAVGDKQEDPTDYLRQVIRQFAASGSYSACFLEMASAEKLAQWAKDRGVPNVVPPDRMHCTIHHSDTQGVGPDYELLNQRVTVDNYEGLEQFGPDNEVLVLVLGDQHSQPFEDQYQRALDSGAVPTTPRTYVAHVTLSYDAPGFIITDIPDFPITFGPEAVGQVDDELQRNFMNPNHLPGGTSQGGQFAPADGGMQISDLTKVGAKPGGSVPGAMYQDKKGQKWIVKYVKSAERAHNEVLAAKLYDAAGVSVPVTELVAGPDGKTWLGSKFIDKISLPGKALKSDTRMPGLDEGLAADAWLANWDVAGLEYDNIGAVDGKAVRLDVGGALEYRAMGAAKGAAFGNTPTELSTLLDPSINRTSAAIFKNANWKQVAAGADRIAGLSSSTIHGIVDKFGYGSKSTKAALADKLIARKAALLDIIKNKKYFNPAEPRTPKGQPGGGQWSGEGGSGKMGGGGADGGFVPKVKAVGHPSLPPRGNEATQKKSWQELKTLAAAGDKEAIKEFVYLKARSKLQAQMRKEIKEGIASGKYGPGTPGKPAATGDEPYVPKAFNPHIDIFDTKHSGSDGAGDKKASAERTRLGSSLQGATKYLTETEKSSVRSYTGAGYNKMNKLLRAGDPPTSAVKNIDAALAKQGAPEDFMVFRRFGDTGKISDQLKAGDPKLIGTEVTDKGFVSTTIHAPGSIDSPWAMIRVHKGSPGMYVKPISNYPGEEEFLIPRNGRFKVMGYRKVNGKNIMELDWIT